MDSGMMYGSTFFPLSSFGPGGTRKVYWTCLCVQASVSYGMCMLTAPVLCSKSSQSVLLNRMLLPIELWKDREGTKQSNGGRQQDREKELERGEQANRAIQPGATRTRKCSQ